MKENQPPPPELIAQQLRKPSGEMATVVGNAMNKSNESLYDLVLDTMRLQDGESVLEIGFGNGKFFDKLFLTTPGLKITGLDYSEEMVNEAKENNSHHVEAGRLQLQQGSSDKMPFADNNFDKIFCCNVIYFWDEPSLHLREIHRVLKPGGSFYVGFRNKETMAAFPFTQFGFTLYEGPEWEHIMTANNFIHTKTTERKEQLQMEEQQIELKAYCVVARK
jgi:ubiquinone/menaquinone biosynthesis C-methylase UbiE